MDINVSHHELPQNDDPQVAEHHNVDTDEQPNNIPFDVSELLQQLAAGDVHHQDEVNTTHPRSVTLSKLCTMYHNQDLLGAMKLLSGHHRLIIDDDHIVPMDGPNVVPCVGPHYIDHTLYVGSHQGLDAGLPKILADHNWQVILDLANVYHLWPDSNVTGLPFNPMGCMVYIGTRLQEQLWVALVPRTFFEPNHLDNARATHPTLNEPTTALSQPHLLMFIMFIAYALGHMHLHDIHCSIQYPVPLTHAAVKRSMDILGKGWENHCRIILQLEDFKWLHDMFNGGWNDWVDQAPLQWKEDNFLVNNAPVGVMIRYGQNQPLIINGALDFTFSLATHMSYLDVWEWCNVHNYWQHEDDILYDKSNNDPTRTEVDLEDLPLLDEEGFEVNIYNEQGFRVPRRAPVQFSTCGAWVAIDEMKWCASRDSVEGKDVDLFISEAISHVCQSLKINHIPWSMNQVGGGGTPSSVIIHDVWLNLGATAIPRPPSSASFLTRQESLQIIALNS
ncbi:hypothetical protein BD769DRAFT_1679717 [Suillus cothurnatus]|nr:hypothetical protein BD769DRAFT_1679717 [Suillus cothurnatus]